MPHDVLVFLFRAHAAGAVPAQGGIAEELSAALQAGAPSFFREDDKTFYRASALLQRAAEVFPGPDAGQLASQVRIVHPL